MANFNDLVAGYHRFRANGWVNQRERWQKLADQQNPKIIVIACSDSRVDPAQIFDTAPGEIFTVRNVANLVPPFESDAALHGVSAALEFGVTQLNIPEIVIVGHAKCGGVHASLSGCFHGTSAGQGYFIDKWMEMIDPERERIVAEMGQGPDAALALELETVRVSLRNLRSFPFIREREADGRLTLHGAYFGIAEGKLQLLDNKTGAFRPA